MNLLEYTFSGKKVRYFLDASFAEVENIVSGNNVILVVDENVHRLHAGKLGDYKKIVIASGEQHKNQSTVDHIINELIKLEADRKTFIIGIGGGVLTDITGFAASIYMRGLRFGFVPTTILAQVDASIGGKNGIDVGVYKNLVGFIRQPEFILFDYSFLESLPLEQWINGFAEIIKHGCIKDRSLFELLEQHLMQDFRHDPNLLAALIERNVRIKSEVVQNDEFENGDRKLLNFGHTLGHAIENVYQLPHGHAISIGMAAASKISQQVNDFDAGEKERVLQLLHRYHLQASFAIDKEKIFGILKMDKKRTGNEMSFILLNKIGQAVIKTIPLSELEELLLKTA